METVVTAKYVQIAELFKRRIHNGDYSFCSIPGAPKLAQETGVSYLTARQAIQKLIDDGLLQRAENGRLEIRRDLHLRQRQKKIVFLHPIGEFSPTIWRQEICRIANTYDCQFREIVYCHDDDPLLYDALDGDFDLIFLQFNRHDSLFLDKLKKNRHRLVTLFHDLTEHGIRCLDGVMPNAISTLMKYLYDLGHRKIDCFNSQPYGPVIKERIDCWQNALTKFGCTGVLHNYSVKNFSLALPHARKSMSELLESGKFDATALFCISVECASGVIRSCYDHHVRVPEDLSVATFGNPANAAVFIPAITTIDMPNPMQVISKIFDQFLGITPNDGQLMFRAETETPVIIGESTGKCNVTIKS